MNNYTHIPVLLEESIKLLDIKAGGVYIDVTYGKGGHSKEILNKLGNGRLIAFDQDSDIIKDDNIKTDERITIINNNFRYIKNFIEYFNIKEVDGILGDLGISSIHIDSPERGFSTRYDAELDMRMDRRKKLDAKTVINEYAEEKIIKILREYGELPDAKRISNAIIKTRQQKEINTTYQLKECLSGCINTYNQEKFYAKVFQAIRIEVNQELEALKELLLQSYDILKTGGRIAIISYHSLEDRIVKNYFRSGNLEGNIEKDFYGNIKTTYKLITKKAIVASEDELKRNNRARSAKLRVAEKI
ncbi:MAG: 16S rRNA (cytosine(1402)-N(4))-methyltransferase RsmH [Bacteroidales bacterium]|nr:16S rRNA (cytosine(1402)-N(4))-methyltransferase RsmH [Bacteroidales bacterium]